MYILLIGNMFRLLVCVLFVKEAGNNRWMEFGRTETIMNNLNPEWTKKFHINYFFEERQFLKFEMCANLLFFPYRFIY